MQFDNVGTEGSRSNGAYDDGLRAAALIAERVRDAKTQLGDHAGADAAEQIRARIQTTLDT